MPITSPRHRRLRPHRHRPRLYPGWPRAGCKSRRLRRRPGPPRTISRKRVAAWVFMSGKAPPRDEGRSEAGRRLSGARMPAGARAQAGEARRRPTGQSPATGRDMPAARVPSRAGLARRPQARQVRHARARPQAKCYIANGVPAPAEASGEVAGHKRVAQGQRAQARLRELYAAG